MRFKQWRAQQLNEAPASLFGTLKQAATAARVVAGVGKNIAAQFDTQTPRASTPNKHVDAALSDAQKNATHKAVAALKLLGWSTSENLKSKIQSLAVQQVELPGLFSDKPAAQKEERNYDFTDAHSQPIFVGSNVKAVAIYLNTQGWHDLFKNSDIDEARDRLLRIPDIKGAVFGALVLKGKTLPATWFISFDNDLQGKTNIAAPSSANAQGYSDISDVKGLEGLKAKKQQVVQMRAVKSADKASRIVEPEDGTDEEK